eukprot:356792-Chlamydomonas_euryale.AAC.4
MECPPSGSRNIPRQEYRTRRRDGGDDPILGLCASHIQQLAVANKKGVHSGKRDLLVLARGRCAARRRQFAAARDQLNIPRKLAEASEMAWTQQGACARLTPGTTTSWGACRAAALA